MAQKSWARGEPMVLTELPTPEPRNDEVRVRVEAIGVNPVDWKMREKGPLRLAARFLGPPPPVVIGVDFAGVVDAVGPKVSAVAVGDRVVGGTNFSRKQRGSYADTALVREDQVAKIPHEMDAVVAASLPVAGVTAHMCIHELGRLRPGQKALVLGASGAVGQLAVQLAKLAGGTAVGVCSKRNVDLVSALGVPIVLDYTASDPLEAARAHGPFQVVVDCAGGYSGSACRRLLGPGGRHLMVASEGIAGMLNTLVPPFSSRLVLGRPTAARLAKVVEAVTQGMQVAVSERLPLAAAEEAHEKSHGGRLTGKIVLLP